MHWNNRVVGPTEILVFDERSDRGSNSGRAAVDAPPYHRDDDGGEVAEANENVEEPPQVVAY